MIPNMESYLGKQVKPELREELSNVLDSKRCLITRPDFCGDNIHINMYIQFDEDYRITDIDGDKCYSYYRGMYNRSSSVSERPFSKRDIAYLQKFIRQITV